VRDHIDRKEKQTERNAELVVGDRLAALKANDMRFSIAGKDQK